MSFLKWFKKKKETSGKAEIPEPKDEQQLSNKEEEEVDTTWHNDEEKNIIYKVKFVYFLLDLPNNDILHVLKSVTKDLQTFTIESECIKYITSITNNKVFLIIDGSPSSTLLEEMEKLKQIDSVFIYSSSSDSKVLINQKKHSYLVHVCDYENVLMDSIIRSSTELDKHIAALCMYDRKEKAIRNLSKDVGSYVYLELFKYVINNIPKTREAITTMVTTCQNYYRGNLIELRNIDDFDREYVNSTNAIPWYLKECFLSKFINKVLRTEDVNLLYQFRFYILDLSEQLEFKCLELRQNQNGILKLYGDLKLSPEEIVNLQNSIGNLISINGYLSATSERSVAYDYVTKAMKGENGVRALLEYQIDLNVAKNIVLADVRAYSKFPEIEFLIDMGSTFQIDSCEYNSEEDLWHVQVHAKDLVNNSVIEHLEYQKKNIRESNRILIFGILLLEMGEYAKAERYFDTILNSSNPNDEEIACVFFYFGRIHRSKGDLYRAIDCYNRAYQLHMNAKPKRSASAGKTVNGLGVVYSEQGKVLRAQECFQQAMELYKESLPKEHEDIAATLINLGTVDSDRDDHDQAMEKYLHAKKIYDRVLPPSHPSHALPRVNLGNAYLSAGQYDKALEEYESALHLQENLLPSDHPDLIRTLYNLSVLYTRQGKMELSKEYLDRAEEIGREYLPSIHSLNVLIKQTKYASAVHADDQDKKNIIPFFCS